MGGFTFGALCIDALTEINALTPGAPIPAADMQLALTRGNAFIDSSNARTLIQSLTRLDTLTLPTAAQSYTIGPTGVLVLPYRPNDIQAAAMVDTDSPPNYTDMTVVSAAVWESFSQLGFTATVPAQLWYERTYPNGTIWIRGVPAASDYLIRLETRQLTGQGAALTTAFQGPPGWYEAFMYSLAERLCNPFGKTGEIVQQIAALALKARLAFATANRMETARPLPPDPFTLPLMGEK